MNNSTQAQKGFRTFLLTLSVSLIVFSIMYYVVTNVTPAKQTNIPADIESNAGSNVAGTTDTAPEEENLMAEKTVFADLAAQKMEAPVTAVLAGSTTQTTQSTTPEGGVTSITIGLIMSALAFFAGIVIIAKDPRKLALSGYESDITKGL